MQNIPYIEIKNLVNESVSNRIRLLNNKKNKKLWNTVTPLILQQLNLYNPLVYNL